MFLCNEKIKKYSNLENNKEKRQYYDPARKNESNSSCIFFCAKTPKKQDYLETKTEEEKYFKDDLDRYRERREALQSKRIENETKNPVLNGGLCREDRSVLLKEQNRCRENLNLRRKIHERNRFLKIIRKIKAKSKKYKKMLKIKMNRKLEFYKRNMQIAMEKNKHKIELRYKKIEAQLLIKQKKRFEKKIKAIAMLLKRKIKDKALLMDILVSLIEHEKECNIKKEINNEDVQAILKKTSLEDKGCSNNNLCKIKK